MTCDWDYYGRYVECNITDVPTKRDRFKFNLGNASADAIYILHISSNIYDCGFDYIPTEIFDIFPNLEVCTIATSLRHILQTGWQDTTNLEELELKDTQVELYAYIFKGLNRLRKFYINWKPGTGTVQRIRKVVFTGMNNLTDLYLRNNEIHTIDDGAFNLPNLIKLDLRNNKLRTLYDLSFCTLPNLGGLTLRNNQLTHLGQSLSCLTNIVYLDLYNNSIKDIDLFKLAKLTRLRILNLKSSGFSFRSNEIKSTVSFMCK